VVQRGIYQQCLGFAFCPHELLPNVKTQERKKTHQRWDKKDLAIQQMVWTAGVSTRLDVSFSTAGEGRRENTALLRLAFLFGGSVVCCKL